MTQPRFYTTTVDAARSAGEIGEMVRKYGATLFQIEYDGAGEPSAIAFTVHVEEIGADVPVKLRAQTDALAGRLRAGKYRYDADARRAQAHRVAWRQLRALVEMQLELVANGVVAFEEVFFHGILAEGGKRLVDVFHEEPQRFLPGAERSVIALPSGTHD